MALDKESRHIIQDKIRSPFGAWLNLTASAWSLENLSAFPGKQTGATKSKNSLVFDTDRTRTALNKNSFLLQSDMPSEEWLLDASPILFQDRMMSDTVTGEHSYSSAQQEVHMVLPDIKMEEGEQSTPIFLDCHAKCSGAFR